MKIKKPVFFIGYDSKEDIAYRVCKQSLLNRSSIPISVKSLKLYELVSKKFYTRLVDPLASTEFTYSRFLIPELMNFNGWAIFFFFFFLCFEDVSSLFSSLDENKALFCVQHNYTPKEKHKMDGKKQTLYPRKNWSSFMIFNCSHPSNKKLTKELVNSESGSYLHQLKWLKDSEIGSLDERWNWLEGWTSKHNQKSPYAVHFTRGGPWFDEWQDVEFAEMWKEERDKYLLKKYNL